MAFIVQENARIQQHFATLEHRPMLLKDFLRDDAVSSRSSCIKSSSKKSKKPHIVLLRSWSKRAAATKISAVHKVIKLLQFSSSRSPRKLTDNKRGNCNCNCKDDDSDRDIIVGNVTEVKVKVKDILRWRSFRDLEEENHPRPLIFSPSPHRRTTTAASYSDSEENEDFSTFKNPKGDWSSFEEYEQQSPVSVLDSPFRQVQEFTHFHPILENIQREKFDVSRRTQEKRSPKLEGIAIYEERARELLRQVGEDHDDDVDVLMDFFIDELSRNGNKLNNDEEFNCEILRIAKSWIDGELEESYEWEVEEERESFVKDMERGTCWNKFDEDREELCKELEVRVLNHLLDDLVVDLLR